MKKIVLIVFTVFTSSVASAQKIHFTDTSNHWSVFRDTYNDGNPLFFYSGYDYMHDTTINSIEYKIFSFGVIREDSLLKKVYIRASSGDSDIVLMDYNLHVGDTFTAQYDTFHHFYYNHIVSSIDSTLINGVWHKVWHFPSIPTFGGSGKPSFDIIEGVGCIRHPIFVLFPGGVEPDDYHMYCFSNQGITPHLSPAVGDFDNANSCITYPHLSTNELKHEQTKTFIYPNPATTSLTITSPTPITTLSITNLLGQVVFTHHYNTDQVHIDIADLPKGLYFVKVNDREVRKFLKE